MQPNERPLGELFAELARETGHLIKQELQLVKAETMVKARQSTRNLKLLAVGAGIASVGALTLTAALVAQSNFVAERHILTKLQATPVK